MATQNELAMQMVRQLRVLDPSVSAEVGTPERKIIDTVAQALSDAQIDLGVLQGELDLTNKHGASLDRFLALFGFARQSATYATGFVTFSRNVASTSPIRIPLGTQLMAPISTTVNPDDSSVATNVVFRTTFDVTLPTGDTEIVAPVQAVVPGTSGNVAANRISVFVGEPVVGITSVTNLAATRGGQNPETDEELKVRFRNTIFRNLAGTEDQYLALAVSTSASRKAKVVGSISRYREYIQVPPVDDASSYDAGGTSSTEAGNGIAGEYTTALSTIPYAKYIYDDVAAFVSNSEIGPLSVFYREGVDWELNTGSTRYRGDTYRLETLGLGDNPSNTVAPNVTFTNVYTGAEDTIEAVRPNDILLLEFSYLSSASRNDYHHNIFNCVDVFVDGGSATFATNIIHRPNVESSIFADIPSYRFYRENYRRVGEPTHRPILGNVFTPLFWEPVTDLPGSIVVEADDETHTFLKDVHYWLVEDVSDLHGTVRARNGIEWSTGVPAQTAGDPEAGPFTGKFVTELPADTPITIEDYEYDRNIVELQALLEANKQVTTDVLAHKSKVRYFKIDLTAMYNRGASVAETNLQVQSLLGDWFDSFYYGGTVQLSDILQVIHSASGIDNIRWTSDVPEGPDASRVYECDINGNPLQSVIVDRVRQGSTTRDVSEIQQIHIGGSPTGGTFTLGVDGTTDVTGDLAYNISAADLQTALRTLTGDTSLTVTGTDPYVITYSGTDDQPILVADSSSLEGSEYVYNNDFFLRDNELPALPVGAIATDTLPGLVIRPRAQNVWIRR